MNKLQGIKAFKTSYNKVIEVQLKNNNWISFKRIKGRTASKIRAMAENLWQDGLYKEDNPYHTHKIYKENNPYCIYKN